MAKKPFKKQFRPKSYYKDGKKKAAAALAAAAELQSTSNPCSNEDNTTADFGSAASGADPPCTSNQDNAAADPVSANTSFCVSN